MALSLTHADLPYPVKHARFSFLLEFRDSAGALTNPTSPDTEVSTDGGATFADAAEEVSPTAGYGYITLTGAETNNAALKVQAKGTGVLTTTADLYPRDFPVVRAATAQAGAASTITLDASASSVDDFYNGAIVRTTGGTGGGGAGGANNQARTIIAYVGSTKVATIEGAWETNPSSDTTFDILAADAWVQAAFERTVLGVPPVAPAAAGGLITRGTGAGQLSVDGGRADSDLQYVFGAALSEGGAGRLAASFVKFGDVATPLFTAAAAMRGTDNAALATKLLAYLQLLTRSDAAIATDNATELTEINADGGSGGGDFSNQTDAEEALQDLIAALNNLSTSDIDARLAAIHLDHLYFPTELTVNAAPAPTATTFGISPALTIDAAFDGTTIRFVDGTLNGTTRTVKSYASGTGVFTFEVAWPTIPVAGEAFVILGVQSHGQRLGDGAITAPKFATDSLSADALKADAAVQIAAAVWDRLLTAATHNIATSAGRRLRDVASKVIRSDTAQGPGTGTNQIQLDSGASATDGMYDPSGIDIVEGTGAGQSRLIVQYDGGTVTATVDRDWKVAPAADSEFVIYGHPGREHVNEGLAQAGSANTITLNTLGSATDGAYVGQIVFLRSGTGQDQAGIVTAYNGTTKVATIKTVTNGGDWETNPDTTTGYVMLPAGLSFVAAIHDDTITDAALAADTDVYTAKITVIDDESNTTDRWLVAWFKNGVPLGTGTVTSPTVQVIKSADGTNLFAATPMTEIASTGYFRKTQASTRVVSGTGYIAVAVGTIGGSSRTWSQPIGRDSTA